LVDLVVLQSVSYVAAAIGVCAAAIYYMMVLREQRRSTKLTLETRQAQLFMQMYTTFTSYEFKSKWNDIMHLWEWKSLEDFNSKYGYVSSNSEEFSKLDFVATFFEGIGVLVKRGLIDVTLVDDLMSGHVVSSWERFEPPIMEWREKMNWPQLLEWWEYLYHEVKGIMEKQHPELVSKKVATYSENRMESD